MENQYKSVVYVYSFWADFTLNTILSLNLPFFRLFLFSQSYYKFVTLILFIFIFLGLFYFIFLASLP